MSEQPVGPAIASCAHRVSVSEHRYRRGPCENCGEVVVANGCGPGWIPLAEVETPGNGWAVMPWGEALWFGDAR